MNELQVLEISFFLHGEKEYKIEKVIGYGGGITYLVSSKIEIGSPSPIVYFAIKEYFEKGVCYRDSGSPIMTTRQVVTN